MHVVPPAEHQPLTDRHPRFDPSNFQHSSDCFSPFAATPTCSNLALYDVMIQRDPSASNLSLQHFPALFSFPSLVKLRSYSLFLVVILFIFLAFLRDFEQCYVYSYMTLLDEKNGLHHFRYHLVPTLVILSLSLFLFLTR